MGLGPSGSPGQRGCAEPAGFSLLFPSLGSRLLRCLCLSVLLELWVPQAPLGNVAESQQRAPVTTGMSSLGWEGEMGRAGGDVAVTRDASAVPRACGEPRADFYRQAALPSWASAGWKLSDVESDNNLPPEALGSPGCLHSTQHNRVPRACSTQLPSQRLGAGLHAQLPSTRGL